MRIRTIWSRTGPSSRTTRRSFPSGMALGAVATVILAAVAWLPTAGVTRQHSHLAPASYSMPHKNAAQTGETPATIKRAPATLRPGHATTIRVGFPAAGGPLEPKPTPGKRS